MSSFPDNMARSGASEEQRARFSQHASALRVVGWLRFVVAAGQLFHAAAWIWLSSGAWEAAASGAGLDRYAVGFFGGFAIVGGAVGAGLGLLSVLTAAVGYGLTMLGRWVVVPATILAGISLAFGAAGLLGTNDPGLAETIGLVVMVLTAAYVLYLLWSSTGRSVFSAKGRGAVPAPGGPVNQAGGRSWVAVVFLVLNVLTTAAGILLGLRELL